MKTEQKKQAYTAPVIEVIEMENEGIIASSVPGYGNGGNVGTPTKSAINRSYRGASSNDLEDMINDILTVEN